VYIPKLQLFDGFCNSTFYFVFLQKIKTYKSIQIISIELLNDNALSLLKELEVLNILRLVKTEEAAEEITDAHKAIIDGRLADYRANPDSALDWEDVKRELGGQ